MASAICAICYEEAKPVLEDLQSISQCGHVFHELCLQQWMEYHPPGKKSTCPLCKQQCSHKDVHRLYFQSSSDPTQPSQGNSSTVNSDPDVQSLQNTVQKLTGQLHVTKCALEANQNQIQELNKELSVCTARAQKAEAAQKEASKEKLSLRDALSRIQEELKKATAERCKLYEKNTTLVKELASNKLFQNLEVDEDEAARMAHVGSGNKDDVIRTLTKSLIVRNRAYKELMAKCNELGVGESKALNKAEKAIERMRTLKARVQELEKILEEKENASLRSLKVSLDDTNLPNNKSLLKKKVVACRPGVDPLLNETMSIVRSNDLVKFGTSCTNSQLSSTSLARHIEENDLKPVCRLEETEIRNTQHKESANLDSQETSVPGISEDKSNSDSVERSCLPITIKKEVRISAGVTSEISAVTTKWCKQSANGRTGESPTGTFISYGANGRGGQVKILRPPPLLKLGGLDSARPAKRLKCSRNGATQQGSLQIEHFFNGGK